eukprot:TRINITY_DN9591_c0_g3_i2.p1 TRINITY_DN9591_c0_g3~~TRINITY_DN9591_c0_g3_i2.p1  ORF type:complete len:828 (+),score=153.35 TRINITY_DN9591_c0_g3_i2:69-2552(+)
MSLQRKLLGKKMTAANKPTEDAELQRLLDVEDDNEPNEPRQTRANSGRRAERMSRGRSSSMSMRIESENELIRQRVLATSYGDSWYVKMQQQRVAEQAKIPKDLPTIDWMYDNSKEIDRRLSLHQQLEHHQAANLWRAFDASQGWIVVFLAGIWTGVISGWIDIGTEWVSYLRFGFCGNGFWLSRNICCVEHSLEEDCTSWIDWGDLIFSTSKTGDFVNYFFYISISMLSAGLCAWIIKVFCPSAAGSGIPEIKVILGGFVMKGFLGTWTLIIKCIGLVMAVGSGLNVGKEGPMIHVACCCGNIICNMFPKYSRNEAKRREIIAAAAAGGVAAAFSAPIGGVLFSLEEASSFFPHKTMLRAFLCATTAAVVVRYVNPYHSFKFVLYEVHYRMPWYWFELPFFIFLGICGGVIGALFVYFNGMVASHRKRSNWSQTPIKEVFIHAAITAAVGYYSPLLRMNSTELIGKLFSECIESSPDEELGFICRRDSLFEAIGGLTVAFVVKLVLTTVTIGIKVPSGLLIPSLAIGACFGRVIGILVERLRYDNADSIFFSECVQSGCITPGVYAMVGAAAVLGGVSRTTVSLAVIMFELTGGLAFMVPIMLAVLTSKWVGDSLTNGIYDQNIETQGYPYIDPRREVLVSTPCRRILRGKTLYVCQIRGDTLGTLEDMCTKLPVHGFPVVTNLLEMNVVGYISRSKLRSAVENAANLGFDPNSICVFEKTTKNTSSQTPSSAGMSPIAGASAPPFPPLIPSPCIDFSYLVDYSPTIVNAGTPIGQLYSIFQKLGIRLVLVLHYGRLIGIISKKDIIVTADGHPRAFVDEDEDDEF